MQTAPVRVLLVEDDEDDYILTRDVLDSIEQRQHEIVWCQTFGKALNLLAEQSFDVALIDYRIGQETGIELLKLAKASGHDLPMILLTGLDDRDIDVTASEAGAFDYIVKDELTPTRAERTIRFACAFAATRRSLIKRTEGLQAALDNVAGRGLVLKI